MRRKTLDFLNPVFSLCRIFNVIPYPWNKHSYSFHKDLKLIRKILWISTAINLWIWETFLVTRLISALTGVIHIEERRKQMDLVLNLIWAICGCLQSMTRLNSILNKDEFLKLINEMIQINLEFEDQKLMQGFDIFSPFIKFFHFVVIALMTLVLVLFIQNPNRHFYYSSIIPAALNYYWLHFVVIAGILEAFSFACIWLITLFECFVHMNYVYTAIMMIDGVRNDKYILKIETFVHKYKTIQLFNQLYNSCSSTIFIPALKVLLGTTLILGNFGTIKFHGKINPFLYLTFPITTISLLVFQIAFYPNVGKIYESTKELISGNAKFGRTKHCRALINSCKPFGVKVGSYYIFEKKTILTYWNVLILNTVNVLVIY